MAPGSAAGVSTARRIVKAVEAGRRTGRPGPALVLSALEKLQLLWRLLAFLVPPPRFSSVTEGLMTATQSGDTALQLQLLQERRWEGDEMDSVCCQHLLPLQGDQKRGVARLVMRTLKSPS